MILETTMAIDFSLKLCTIFIEKVFSNVRLTTIHHPSFLDGISIFLEMPMHGSSFLITSGQSNHISFTSPPRHSLKIILDS
jgi:hypothetical protein